MMNGGWNGGWNGGVGGVLIWLLMVLFVAAIVVGVVLLFRNASARGSAGQSHNMIPGAPGPPVAAAGSALKVLEERYAKGDIDREEFLQRKQDLTEGR